MSSDEKLLHAFRKATTVLVDPVLPSAWDATAHEDRPSCHRWAWEIAYVRSVDRPKHIPTSEWLEWWPAGKRYEVRCLDGGAWDRSTSLGDFATLAGAIEFASARNANRYEQMFGTR